MKTLEERSIGHKALKKLENSGYATAISWETTLAISQDLSDSIRSIRKDFEMKERNSRYVVAMREMRRVNI